MTSKADQFFAWARRQPWPLRWLLGVLVMFAAPVAVVIALLAIPLLIFEEDHPSGGFGP